MNGAWTLIQTKPGAEVAVTARLAALQLPHLFPRLLRTVQGHGRSYDRIEAAFPRYVFVWVLRSWQLIKQMRGVQGFVSMNGSPSVVPQRVIDELMGRIGSEHLIDVRVRYEQGQPVKLGELDALFSHMSGADRCVVLIRMFGSWREVSAGIHEIS